MACDEDPNQDRPGSPWDFALLGFAIAASIPFLCANAVIFFFRKRKYFQAQGGSALILTSSISGLLWIVSCFVVNMQFHRHGTFLEACPLWSFWIQLTFGFWLWLVCLILRLYRLYILCTAGASSIEYSKTWTVYFPVLWVPAVIVAIIATAMKASRIENPASDCANCEIGEAWAIISFLILPICYFPILVILLFRLKGAKDFMLATEYRRTSEHSLMAFVIYLLYGVSLQTKTPKKVFGRLFSTFCVCCLVFLHFWVRMGWPVYLCLFKGQSEMDNFENELRWCGAECFDKITSVGDSRHPAGRTMTIPSTSLHDGDWILRAIDAAMVEASECKERIDQLEQKKAKLSSKIKELELMTSSGYL